MTLPATNPRPMDGVRVLDIATFIAAPMAASIMGEFGADVIKIEQPSKDGPVSYTHLTLPTTPYV